MSSPSRAQRRYFLLFGAAALSAALSACSFSPVYGPGSASPELNFTYADPKSQLEQIVYQDLALRFARTAAPKGHLSVSLDGKSRDANRSAGDSLFEPREYVLTGTVIVTDINDNETVLFKETRSAAASFEVSGQVLADRAATDDARQRAAHALADTLRLSLIAAFAAGI